MYKYVAVYIDDLAFVVKDPQTFVKKLEKIHKFKLKATGPLKFHLGADFEKDPDIINGLNDFKVDLRTHLNINDAKFVRLISSEDSSEAQIELNNFKPGSVVAIRFTLQKTQHDACVGIQKLLW